MPRAQNILAENPILQGVSTFADSFEKFTEKVNKTRTDYTTFTQLNNIGRARLKPNYQSILDKVQAGLGVGEKVTEEGKAEALRQAGLPNDAQNPNLAVLYDKVTRDRKRAALATAAIQAEQGMAREAQIATINQNLGLVGMMDAGQQKALTMGLSSSMDGFDLTGLFDVNFGGSGGGKSGGGGGDGSSGGHNWQKHEVDNGDGTTTLMMVDPKTGMTIPATTANGEPVVSFSNEKASYDMDGPVGKALMPSSVRNGGKPAIDAWKANIIQMYANNGYIPSGTDGEGTITFKKVGGGGGGKVDKSWGNKQKELLGRAKAAKGRWQALIGKVDGDGDETGGVAKRRAQAIRDHNSAIIELKMLDPDNAGSYKTF